MPGAIVKKTRRRGAQSIPKSIFAEVIDQKTKILSNRKDHRAIEEERNISKGRIGRFPPADAPGNGREVHCWVFGIGGNRVHRVTAYQMLRAAASNKEC